MTAEKQKSSVEISETFWGYIVREAQDRFDRESVTESGLRFLGLILVLAAYGQWLLPGSLFLENVLAMKMVMSFVFAATGVGLYMFASRGFRQEVQVDIGRRELRFVARNSRGHSRLQSRIPMDGVESAFVKRNKDVSGGATLYIRLHGVDAALQVLSGKNSDLTRLHKRICHDLSPREVRLERGIRATGMRGTVPA